ncbi:haloalkane dehalogenase [Hirschia maritima]|uniref:haloalkane dehalogenase n=1 Tax=Hirschia maritima TaxID=1121961 RepID=UPI0003814813|nr:haloalkane dehalogenase [Hirschia maritima]
MDILRTPDSRFQNLPDYEFAPHYYDVVGHETGTLRLHYIDEGPKDGRVILMMHGEPSWSYLYRFMIKKVSEAGFRVIAPDLIGFGRSDKPSETSDYTYSRHVDWMSDWFEALKIQNAVLFCQDWGGLIGLRLVAKYSDQFSGVIAANTGLPTGEHSASEAFLQWQEYSQSVPVFPAGGVISRGTVRKLSDTEIAAYDAPYPDETYKAGARIFPKLVPTSPDADGAKDNKEAWKVLSQFNKPFLTCFSDQDPVTAGGEKIFQKLVPGCEGQDHTILTGGGHFLQEDVSDELSDIIIKFAGQV